MHTNPFHSFAASASTRGALAMAALCMAVLSAEIARAEAEEGFYGGLTCGTAMVDGAQWLESVPDSASSARSAANASERLVAYTLFGGYRLSRHIHIEGARTSFATTLPNIDDPNAPIYGERAATWSVSTVGLLPLSNAVSLFARIGLHSPDGLDGLQPLTDTYRLGRLYGFGVSVRPTHNVELRLESERLTRLDGQGTDANSVTFGASLRF